MFMVDCVELFLFNQVHNMRELEGCHAMRFKQNGESLREIVDIRHMRKHIVGGHQISLPALAGQPCRQANTEKLFNSFNAFLS